MQPIDSFLDIKHAINGPNLSFLDIKLTVTDSFLFFRTFVNEGMICCAVCAQINQ